MHALVLGGLGALVPAGVTAADPRPLPVSHSTETVLEGELRVTQIADLVPSRRSAGEGQERVVLPGLQTEFEGGVHDRLELAFAITLAPSGAFEDTRNGIRQRAKFVAVYPGDWWVDVAIVAETTQNDRAFEAEGRAVVRATFDRVKLVGNAGAEHVVPWEPSAAHETIFLGTLAATYEIVPRLVVGAEGFVRDHHEDPEDASPQVFAGPVVQARLGKLGVTAGAYARATDREVAPRPGDALGRYWFRLLVGFDL